VIPSRNNLEFLKLAYKSIRQLDRTHTEVFDGCASREVDIKHDILVLNDASEDGTLEWLDSLNDDSLIVYTNPGSERIGIVGMFDKGIEMARTDIIFAFHSDMVAGKNLDINILKHLERGKVVSATRVEPPLHPPGPEKIIEDFGIEPEDFSFSKWYSVDEVVLEQKDKTTEGIFAPWCMYKDDFLSIGGHDELFAPQSREDSDLFNRFLLNGYELIQSWDGLVYHFTSRGSRFNKFAGGDTGVDSPEWQQTNSKNMRNFIRKWGTNVQHNEYMKPIISPKYNIGFVVKNCSIQLLQTLEPWCSTIYTDFAWEGYIRTEQENTSYDLTERVYSIHSEKNNDVLVRFDGNKLTDEGFQFLTQLPEILKESGEIGDMEYGIFEITINSLETYEKDLIKCDV
jgi:glycosyltransferase involved in cell wall biosynthesis